MIRILFTKGRNPVSWLIRKVTRESVSHCAVEVDGLVFHSNFKGLICEPLIDFLEHSEALYWIEVGDDVHKLLRQFAKNSGALYDFGAMIYLGLRLVLPFLPKKNLWQTTGMFLSTEWATQVLDNNENSKITPYQLFLRLTNEKLAQADQAQTEGAADGNPQ